MPKTKTYPSTGELLYAFRKKLGWSQQKLADACNPKTSRDYISEVENSVKIPSIEWVERIAIALKIEPRELIRRHGRK